MQKKTCAIRFQRGKTPHHNPKFGFFGLFGLLGFLGILTYRIDQTAFPFVFFAFFGFFGYFFAGKTASAFHDERYESNVLLAERNSYRIGQALTFGALLPCCYDYPFSTNEGKFLFLIISLPLIFAAVTFLREFLLYRYDFDFAEEE